MKRFLVSILVTSFLVSSLALPVFANDRWYGSVSALGVYQDDTLTNNGRLEMNTGWGLAGAIGMAVNPSVDVEVEYAYRDVGPNRLHMDSVDGSWNTHSVMANAYFKPVSLHHDKVTPYLGGGLGYAFHNFEVNTETPWKDNVAVLAYQVMAGTYLDFGWGPQVKVGYRMFSTNDGTFGGVEANTLNHNLEVGFRF